ncbi:MAG TPA: YceI family protein [Solirubrobacteraceae bacterium]|nr:YceI family protein [Solirubrobacteraceae bacterium]
MSTTQITAIPTGTWNVDPSHSSVEFRVKHLGISTVRGQFREFVGHLEVGDDITSSKAYGEIQAASIDTGEPQRDDHLRSPDFFDAESHPEITFESTKIEVLDEDELHVTGNLTMHGITGEITLHVEVTGTEEDPWGNTRVGLEAQGELSRGEWGMKFNQALGSGNMMVSDKVRISAEISAVKAS